MEKRFAGGILGTFERNPRGLLAFYRSSRSSGCTTVDHIKLKLSRKGEAVGSESFVDGSCRVHDEPGVVTLDEIVRLRT